ncbi:class II fructose-bisphosphate aldolase [Sulfurimonas sp. CVO]|jgi:fructose-bisphosphate aldolase class II|uniref:Fructose-bisphosphate aldolase n=1 Tax=Sulfurimonas xiamenensis TaxID=2590021 RepID=A0AAJ4A2P6_9BACT|nr:MULTISPECIES: class II fructose-bisphosphate aldolase [Sulfurimonas]PLY14983.1 MAG: class II fructose-bisphosphate aldolase [Sulfurimonas sp.]QFR42776.1 class II fructose-bisphosphate aldolase [Sulfurimonas xiamenensis]QHG91634.1 class II fructose-bisphosphate aldolase [Sulfurimonas sp. CVO]
MGILDIVKPGVLFGDDVQKVYQYAKKSGFAIPAINVVSTDSINGVLEAAAKVKSPVIIQFSNGGASYYAGKGLSNENEKAATIGAVSGAIHVHLMAESYGVPVILHTDHAAKKLLPWIDALLDAGEEYYKTQGRPLYSSHMLDLSEEPLEENVATCKKYLQRMSKIGTNIEIELGVTGGEEDGVDNTNIDNSLLYTQPEDVAYAYKELGEVSPNFTIAASFGNVHGVYKPGNVVLTPKILDNSQKYIQEKFNTADKPVNFVFHGGSGSTLEEIREAISYGVIKMNVDTDTQWATWIGVKEYYEKNREYLQSQIGNPEGEDKPNKSYYDPRKWLRAGQQTLIKRVELAFSDLNAIGRN